LPAVRPVTVRPDWICEIVRGRDADHPLQLDPPRRLPHGCGVKGVNVNGPALDQETVTLSHELVETVTDPDLDGWTMGKGENEVGELCSGGFAASWSGEKFAVRDMWSNRDRRCKAANLKPRASFAGVRAEAFPSFLRGD
jgi:hypothetical protein